MILRPTGVKSAGSRHTCHMKGPKMKYVSCHFRRIGTTLNHIKCPSCETATLSFSRGEGRYGFCYTISLSLFYNLIIYLDGNLVLFTHPRIIYDLLSILYIYEKGQLQQYKSLSMLLGLLCPIFFSIDLLSAPIFPSGASIPIFLWISPSSINLISALFFKSSCSWSTGYALFVDCHIDRVYAPFLHHLPVTLYAYHISSYTAPGGPGMPIFCRLPHLPLTFYAFHIFKIMLLLVDLLCPFLWIAPSSIDLVCAPFFKLSCT